MKAEKTILNLRTGLNSNESNILPFFASFKWESGESGDMYL